MCCNRELNFEEQSSDTWYWFRKLLSLIFLLEWPQALQYRVTLLSKVVSNFNEIGANANSANNIQGVFFYWDLYLIALYLFQKLLSLIFLLDWPQALQYRVTLLSKVVSNFNEIGANANSANNIYKCSFNQLVDYFVNFREFKTFGNWFPLPQLTFG